MIFSEAVTKRLKAIYEGPDGHRRRTNPREAKKRKDTTSNKESSQDYGASQCPHACRKVVRKRARMGHTEAAICAAARTQDERIAQIDRFHSRPCLETWTTEWCDEDQFDNEKIHLPEAIILNTDWDMVGKKGKQLAMYGTAAEQILERAVFYICAEHKVFMEFR